MRKLKLFMYNNDHKLKLSPYWKPPITSAQQNSDKSHSYHITVKPFPKTNKCRNMINMRMRPTQENYKEKDILSIKGQTTDFFRPSFFWCRRKLTLHSVHSCSS